MTQSAMQVSRMSEHLAPASVQQSFYSFIQPSDEVFPSFLSRPGSACVYGRKLTEAAVVVKERDDLKYPLPIFYPKKTHREPKIRTNKADRKQVQSVAKKTPAKSKQSSQSRPRAKTPSVASQPLKRLIPKQAKLTPEPAKPVIPKLPKHTKPIPSSASSKSVDKITSTEMMRYLEDVPKLLEQKEAVPVPSEPQYEEIDLIVKESLRRQKEQREKREREQFDLKEAQQRKKFELEQHNKMIREINKTRFRREKPRTDLPWGGDQRRILGLAEIQTQHEAQELRNRRRSERAKSAGRSRLGLEILDILGVQHSSKKRQKRSLSDEGESSSHNYSKFDSREIQMIMREQQMAMKEELEYQMLAKQAEEDKRLSQLNELERYQKSQLEYYKRAKKKREVHPKVKPKRKAKKSKRHYEAEEFTLPEDSEVSHIMDRVQESSSNLLEREGRSCLLFGNIEEKPLTEEMGNGTNVVSNIMDKFGSEEKEVLSRGMATAPVADVINSDRSDQQSDLPAPKAQISSLPSLEFEDHNSEPEEKAENSDESVGGREDLLRRKDEVRRKITALRSKMDGIKDNLAEDSERAPEQQKVLPVVKSHELKRIVQEEAAIKIQAHIRRFLAKRRVEEMLRFEERSEGEQSGTEEKQDVQLPADLQFPDLHIRARPNLSLDMRLYEDEEEEENPSVRHDEQEEEEEKSPIESERDHLTIGEFEERLKIEQENFERAKQQEIELLKEENRRLVEEQKKQTKELSEEGYLQMLNTAKEQELLQFQELMQTKCGSRVDLVEEMSMAFEGMLEARYRQLVLLFSQNRERIQAALHSAPSDLDISSTFAVTTAQKAEDPHPFEDPKTPERKDEGTLDSILNKVLGSQEAREIERLAKEQIKAFNAQAEIEAEEEDQPYDPYSARPENPFPEEDSESEIIRPENPSPKEDSESDLSLQSYNDEHYLVKSPDLSEIQVVADRTDEEESYSPMKKPKFRPSDPLSNPLQLQLVTNEMSDSGSRSLSRSGKQRYFKEEQEEKELEHVPSPDPVSQQRASEVAKPISLLHFEGREAEEPAKPSVPFAVSAHLLEDINSSGSFQDDVEEYSARDEIPLPPKPEKVSREEQKTGPPQMLEGEKKSLAENVSQVLIRQIVNECLQISGVRVTKPRGELPVKLSELPEFFLPEADVKGFSSDPERNTRDVKQSEAKPVPVVRPVPIQDLRPNPQLVNEITEDLLRLLLVESIPKQTEKSFPELPPLNFKHLDEHERLLHNSANHTEAPEKPTQSDIREYLDLVFARVPQSQLQAAISTPITFDAVEVLGQLQEIEQGPLITYDLQSKVIIPTEVYLQLDEGRDDQSSRLDLTPSTKDIIRDSKRFHNRLLFDAANEALQKYRPYALKGVPLPWSKNVRSMTSSQLSVPQIQAKVKDEVSEWGTFEVGKIPEGELFLSSGQVDEEHLQMIREEKLSKMLTQEILDNDNMWVEYEAEEAQVKIDVADMILEHIMTEIEDFLHGLEGN